MGDGLLAMTVRPDCVPRNCQGFAPFGSRFASRSPPPIVGRRVPPALAEFRSMPARPRRVARGRERTLHFVFPILCCDPETTRISEGVFAKRYKNLRLVYRNRKGERGRIFFEPARSISVKTLATAAQRSTCMDFVAFVLTTYEYLSKVSGVDRCRAVCGDRRIPRRSPRAASSTRVAPRRPPRSSPSALRAADDPVKSIRNGRARA